MPISIKPPAGWSVRTNLGRLRLKFWRSNYAMHSIMWLLALLTLLFFVGMLLLSHLNLSYSQQAMYELRREQIRDVFIASLTRIDARQIALQRNIEGLAAIGETFARLAENASGDVGERKALQRQLGASLKAHLTAADGVSGAGLWYAPGVLAAEGDTHSVYLTGSSGPKDFTGVDAAGSADSIRSERWFALTVGDSPLADSATHRVFWSPVYFDFDSEKAILTLASPMYDAAGHYIGVARMDWASEQIVDLVSRVEVTDNSFSFLNDRNNRNLSSLSEGDDPVLEQKIIDAILAENLSTDAPDTTALRDASAQRQRMQNKAIEVEGRVYELYYAATPAGMVYGAGVPRGEIDRVLIPMRDINYRILIITGSVLLVLSLYLLYRIVLLMRELQISYTDHLTGLPNRTRILKDLGDRDDACLIVVNLDRFKEINSLFGNDCGDHVLLAMARHMTEFVGSHSRVFGAALSVYRVAGDEFALLGPMATESRVRRFTEELTDFLREKRIYWQQQPLSLDASAGIAFRQAKESDASPDKLLSQATIAVHQAREQMRNYLFYDQLQKVEKGYEQNLYWALRLKNALEKNALVPHFQPIYDNQQKRITKYECLVRMPDDEHGVVAAGQFIGVANKLRLNRHITRVMIEKSFAAFAKEPYEFAINLSYADIVDPEILELILRHLKQSNVGQRVIFEILESDGIENYSEVFRFIEKIKPFGCQIAIDDFGTGYSNFSHLLQLNIDIIKIDGSLIRYLAQDHTAYLVTKGIVQFARSLGIKVVAEFVHSEAVQAKVVELGIEYSQGEYFSMPGPTLIQTARFETV